MRAPQGGLHLEQAPHQLLGAQRHLQPPGPSEEAVAQQHRVLVHGAQHGDVRGLKGQMLCHQQEEHDAAAPEVTGAAVEALEDLAKAELNQVEPEKHRERRETMSKMMSKSSFAHLGCRKEQSASYTVGLGQSS